LIFLKVMMAAACSSAWCGLYDNASPHPDAAQWDVGYVAVAPHDCRLRPADIPRYPYTDFASAASAGPPRTRSGWCHVCLPRLRLLRAGPHARPRECVACSHFFPCQPGSAPQAIWRFKDGDAIRMLQMRSSSNIDYRQPPKTRIFAITQSVKQCHFAEI